MALNSPGSPSEQLVKTTDEVIRAAFTVARQQFGDDPAQAEMFITLAFEWLYYLKGNEVISVDSLVRDYAKLRVAPPNEIADLQDRLRRFKV